MNRKLVTKLLTDTLVYDRLTDRKYYAKEVVLDCHTVNPKRIDVMQFVPAGVIYPSDIEKGIFICYEIKSCMQDVYSGNGLNFYGEKNYIVTTMDTYKKLQVDIREGTFDNFLKEKHPESYGMNYGVLVPVPRTIDLRKTSDVYAEYEAPSPFGGEPTDWKLAEMLPCNSREDKRRRSMTELLFCMLRARHNDTNNA